MQFLESTNFFVRTVLFDFVNRYKQVKLKFRLVPMLHIGSIAYYEKVLEKLSECDKVLYEGVQLKEVKGIAKQYNRIADQLGLVTQREYLKLEQIKEKLINADYDKLTGRIAWQKLRLREKLKLLFWKPLNLFLETQFLTREILAKQFMTAAEENYLAYGPVEDEEGTVENLIMHDREQILFSKLRRKLEKASSEDKLIGIMYGAGHMKTIARYLIDHCNYVPRSGQFLKVFDVQKR